MCFYCAPKGQRGRSRCQMGWNLEVDLRWLILRTAGHFEARDDPYNKPTVVYLSGQVSSCPRHASSAKADDVPSAALASVLSQALFTKLVLVNLMAVTRPAPRRIHSAGRTLQTFSFSSMHTWFFFG